MKSTTATKTGPQSDIFRLLVDVFGCMYKCMCVCVCVECGASVCDYGLVYIQLDFKDQWWKKRQDRYDYERGKVTHKLLTQVILIQHESHL